MGLPLYTWTFTSRGSKNKNKKPNKTAQNLPLVTVIKRGDLGAPGAAGPAPTCTDVLVECSNPAAGPAQSKRLPSGQKKPNKWLENTINKVTPFTIASKEIKYLGINLTEEVQSMYSENDKTMLKEIKGGLNKWKDIPRVHGLKD